MRKPIDVQERAAQLAEAFGPGAADWAIERAADEAMAGPCDCPDCDPEDGVTR